MPAVAFCMAPGASGVIRGEEDAFVAGNPRRGDHPNRFKRGSLAGAVGADKYIDGRQPIDLQSADTAKTLNYVRM